MVLNGLLNIEIGTLPRLCSLQLWCTLVSMYFFSGVGKLTKKLMKLSHISLIPMEIDGSKNAFTTALVPEICIFRFPTPLRITYIYKIIFVLINYSFNYYFYLFVYLFNYIYIYMYIYIDRPIDRTIYIYILYIIKNGLLQ